MANTDHSKRIASSRPRYTCYSYVYDFEFGLNDSHYMKQRSNSLEYFDRYKNRENFRIVIKDGNKVIYSELDR